MGAKYCGNSQVQDQGGEEKGKHHFHHFVAQVSGLRRYLKALMVPSWVCALQLKPKAIIRSHFDQVTRTLVLEAGLHKLWYPGIRDRSTWGKFGAHGEHGDVCLFSNLGAL